MYPHIIHSLWKNMRVKYVIHMIEHKYNTKKNCIVQRVFDTYPQFQPVVDNNYPHHYIL
ncbi:hypothetical protein SAMN05216238_103260 [Lentibacillus persicus]|uniref:Uncharacterized protein n=1 Tax=Lentibacillus persicus TaxID=640948 RepID=A0A1I1UKT6_9BACI|nr:hypothetical protein SAMN05216238_103260 [Lentibacillus persicus]